MLWRGTKQRCSADIVHLIPHEIQHYVEPYAGICCVGRRLTMERPNLKSITFNDYNDDLVAWLKMVQGENQNHGDFIDRLRNARDQFLPENEHEPEIRKEFEACKARWLFEGDPFAWFILHLYAFGKYVSRSRSNIASFDPVYFNHGFTYWTIEKALRFREAFQRAEIRCGDALSWLQHLNKTADGSTLAYLDPPYMILDRRFDLYQDEMTEQQHKELAEILKSARFRFLLSMGDSPKCRDLYVHDKSFRSRFLDQPGFVCRSLYYAYTGHIHNKKGGHGKVGKTKEWLIRNYD